MKQKIKILVDAILTQSDEPQDDIDFVEERLETFLEYFNSVYRDVVMSNINRQLLAAERISREEFQSRIEENDSTRRTCHNVAIGSCAQLNRLCDVYQVERFCPETDDRYEIADFIGTFVYNIYQDGIGKSNMDKAVEVAQETRVDPDRGYKAKRSQDWEEER